MADTATGSNDPAKKSTRSPQKRSAPTSANTPTLGARWQVAGATRVTDDLLRSLPLVAIIGLVVLAKWNPGDVQSLAAVVASILYLPGRAPRGV